ncbi:MAG: hypothetical protein NT067_06135 [Candidatus Diapherotrites archaeon]|nr:hypothetical protein [Candidatus Diapherotrites archaeon]
MKKTLFLLFCLLLFCSAFVGAAQQKVYVCKVHYNRGELSLTSAYTDTAYPQKSEEKSDITYKAQIADFSEKELYTYYFYVPKYLMGSEPLDENGPIPIIELAETDFALILPFFENGKSINVYDQNTVLLLSIDVSKFAVLPKASFELQACEEKYWAEAGWQAQGGMVCTKTATQFETGKKVMLNAIAQEGFSVNLAATAVVLIALAGALIYFAKTRVKEPKQQA